MPAPDRVRAPPSPVATAGPAWLRNASRRAGQAGAIPLRAVFLVMALAGPAVPAAAAGTPPPIPSLYGEARTFTDSIAAAEQLGVAPRAVSGLTVPHHLVAADLIARAFLLARENQYDRIVVLSPDHFKRSRLPFATTMRPFDTVFGPIPVDAAAVETLLGHDTLVEESSLFVREHGIAALLPYVRHFFPETPIIPVAVAIGSTRAEWDAMVAALLPLVTQRTLILQSTDFSHYLPLPAAIIRDQETLNVIAAGDLDAVAQLHQPQHLDSRGAQYIQMRLQAERFGAAPVVIANRNMQFYSARPVAETTSYIVQAYFSPEYAARVDFAGYHDGSALCFAGDTFFGRHLAPVLSRPDIAEPLAAEIDAVLGGCPLVLNLEGVMVPEPPAGLGPLSLAMPEDLTLDWLSRLDVVAVSIANNHSRDLGEEPRTLMAARLRAAGIAVLDGTAAVDLGPLRVLALSDLANLPAHKSRLITADDLAAVAASDAAPPLAAFLHWGREYEVAPGEREASLADALRRAAVSLIVGAHPHRASERLIVLGGGETLLAYSLGNLLFDQLGAKSTGTVLELRFFPQGTFFARLIPIPNFYARALSMR
jgi:poly-gamma-glutamate synthesis protein (capsule biosynthesis protein)